MLFVIDLDTLEIIEGANDKRRVNQREASRGDDAPFEVHFVRAGARQQLPSDAVLTFAAKADLKFDGPAVVLQSGFSLTGSGSTAEYAADVDLATVPLDALLEVDGDDTNDLPFVDLMGEFSWQVEGSKPTTARRFRFRVNNDVYRGGEGTPSALPDPADWMPAPLVLASWPGNASTSAILTGEVASPTLDGEYLIIDDNNGTDENYYFRLEPADFPGTNNVGTNNVDGPKDLYDTVFDLVDLINAVSSIVTAEQSAGDGDGFTLTAKTAGSGGEEITIGFYTAADVASAKITGSVTTSGTDAVTPDALGQLAIVSETDVYAAARVSPAKWVQINN